MFHHHFFFQVDVDADTLLPENTLAPNALEWFLSIGSEAKTVAEAVAYPVVAKAVQEVVDRANVQAASSAQKVQKWTILNQGRKGDSTIGM
jgi:hypothetical protein